MRSLSLTSASFLFGGAGASVVKILEEPVFEGVMEKWAVKRKKAIKQTAPIQCNQVQAGMGLAILEANQATATSRE